MGLLRTAELLALDRALRRATGLADLGAEKSMPMVGLVWDNGPMHMVRDDIVAGTLQAGEGFDVLTAGLVMGAAFSERSLGAAARWMLGHLAGKEAPKGPIDNVGREYHEHDGGSALAGQDGDPRQP